MKTIYSVVLISTLSLLSNSVLAQEGEGKEEGPCKKIRDACVAGGYEKGAHKSGKGLYIDCMKKIMDGGTAEGVTVSNEDVAACKAKKEKRKDKKKGDSA